MIVRERQHERRPFLRGRLVLEGGRREGHAGDVVVRVRLGWRLYAYVARGAGLGDVVSLPSPATKPTARVVALGRGSYSGPLKRAWVVR